MKENYRLTDEKKTECNHGYNNNRENGSLDNKRELLSQV
jgi:hypothetical protein